MRVLIALNIYLPFCSFCQSLVDTAVAEVGMGEEVGTRDGSTYANGQVWILGYQVDDLDRFWMFVMKYEYGATSNFLQISRRVLVFGGLQFDVENA